MAAGPTPGPQHTHAAQLKLATSYELERYISSYIAMFHCPEVVQELLTSALGQDPSSQDRRSQVTWAPGFRGNR